ncbi:hypothetical protein SDC9_158666 [bioreactor metagenome]|uniref:Uncharacterized protein n=1 Tax=bioreactor metagenome TaxID=1076179 RepID=A0A645FAF7_9ZZZZ
MQPQVHALQLCGQDGRLFFRIENDFPSVDEFPAEDLQCVDQKPFKFSEIAPFIVDDFFISDPQIQADIQFLQVLDGQIGVGMLRCGGHELIRLDFRQKSGSADQIAHPHKIDAKPLLGQQHLLLHLLVQDFLQFPDEHNMLFTRQ